MVEWYKVLNLENKYPFVGMFLEGQSQSGIRSNSQSSHPNSANLRGFTFY